MPNRSERRVTAARNLFNYRARGAAALGGGGAGVVPRSKARARKDEAAEPQRKHQSQQIQTQKPMTIIRNRDDRRELFLQLKSIGISEEFELVQMIEDVVIEMSFEGKTRAQYVCQQAVKNHARMVDIEFYSHHED